MACLLFFGDFARISGGGIVAPEINGLPFPVKQSEPRCVGAPFVIIHQRPVKVADQPDPLRLQGFHNSEMSVQKIAPEQFVMTSVMTMGIWRLRGMDPPGVVKA